MRERAGTAEAAGLVAGHRPAITNYAEIAQMPHCHRSGQGIPRKKLKPERRAGWRVDETSSFRNDFRRLLEKPWSTSRGFVLERPRASSRWSRSKGPISPKPPTRGPRLEPRLQVEPGLRFWERQWRRHVLLMSKARLLSNPGGPETGLGFSCGAEASFASARK